MEIVFNPRNIENNNWATVLFLLAFLLIVIVKTISTQRFFIFLNLFFSDKYFKLFYKSEYVTGFFNILLYIVQIITLSFFIILLFDKLNICNKNNEIAYLQIASALFFISIAKYLIEKIIAIIFEIENSMAVFNHYKMSYRSLITMFLLPIVAVIYYNFSSLFFLIVLAFVLIIYNTVTYINILKFYRNYLFSNLFYFILYLCTFEIAPFYFIYYWMKNNLK